MKSICLFIPTLHGGGAERALLQIAGFLLHHGYHVDLVLMKREGAYLPEVPAGIRVVDLGSRRLWTSFVPFVRYLRKKRPHILYSSMPLANGMALWAARISQLGISVVISEHSTSTFLWDPHPKLGYRLLAFIIRVSYTWARLIIAVSEGVASRVRSLPRIQHDQVLVIPNPVDIDQVLEASREEVFHEWMTDAALETIVGVGRLAPEKDFETLIRAFAEARRERPSLRLLILGEGESRQTLEDCILELGLNGFVEMPGFIANPYSYMRRAKAIAVSSKYEGFSLVLVEAMACGTPVVSTKCPTGPEEILDEGRYGRLVEVGDYDALARAILATLSDHESSAVLLERAREYSAGTILPRYLAVFDSISVI